MRSNHTARYVNRLVDEMFVALGEDAFPHNGKAHLYSGPREEVYKQLLDYDFYSNYERALIWAKAHGAFTIDDSRIGQFLINGFSGKSVYDYFFEKHHGDGNLAWIEAGPVWRHASRLYILSLWGAVTTTVCGASDKSVYSLAELRTAVRPEQVALTMQEVVRQLLLPRDKEIETINEVPMQELIELKNKGGYARAQRAICLGEQRLALSEAIKTSSTDEIRDALSKVPADVLADPSQNIGDAFFNAMIEIGKPPVDAMRYFIDSQQRYQIDQRLIREAKRLPAMKAYSRTPDEMLNQKIEKLEEFATLVLHRISAELGLPLEPAIKSAILVPARLPRP